MHVAIVYDRMNTWGGAERILVALHELFPTATFYTAVFDPKRASWAHAYTVCSSFLNRIPFAKAHHEWFGWLTPLAFESFDLDAYDLVISVTSAEAKAIRTKPQTLHVCYCLTPTRYLWSSVDTYMQTPGIGLPRVFVRNVFTRLLPYLLKWDRVASSRPDRYVAISDRVQKRISKYYGRKADAIVYPPVDTHKFLWNSKGKEKGYFLVVSRLVAYKRLDIIIDAFNVLGWPLVVIGSGREKKSLQKRAKQSVHFVSKHLTDEELLGYYQGCRAFVFAADEDFGIVAAEAQACGKPVIAYKRSGVAEIVRAGKTGILFDDQTAVCLVQALKSFGKKRYDPKECQKNAQRFSKDRFRSEMKKTIARFLAERTL